MTKAYLCVLDEAEATHSAVIDLENLPVGADSNTVADFKEQGVDIGRWLHEDLNRASAAADDIRRRVLSAEALFLITGLASFDLNAPPGDRERDLVIGVTAKSVNLIRTSPEVAESTWLSLSNVGRP